MTAMLREQLGKVELSPHFAFSRKTLNLCGWGLQGNIRVERHPEKHIKQSLIDCTEEQAGKDSCELLWNGFLGMEAGCRVKGMVRNLLKL